MSRFVRGIAALVVVGLALTACASKSTPQASGTSANPCSSPSVLTSGALTVGAEFPYYAPFLVGPQSSPTGYEGDMINEIAKRLNLAAVKWVNIAFDQLYDRFSSVMREPLVRRRERLDATLSKFSDPHVAASKGGDLASQKQARLGVSGRLVRCFIDHFERGGHVI